MDKIEKIRQEIERLIEESDFDESANLYSLLSFLDTLEEESDKDLEEAARRYQEGVIVDTTIYYCGACEDVYFANRIADAFIAGAKWQAEQDKETIELAEDHAFLAGSNWQVEQFAKIVRANLSEIGKDAQTQFEKLYFEITGTKMYGGYND